MYILTIRYTQCDCFFPKTEIDIQLYLLYIMHKSALFVWSIINSYLSCRLEPSCLQDVIVTGSTIHYKRIIYHFSNFSWV